MVSCSGTRGITHFRMRVYWKQICAQYFRLGFNSQGSKISLFLAVLYSLSFVHHPLSIPHSPSVRFHFSIPPILPSWPTCSLLFSQETFSSYLLTLKLLLFPSLSLSLAISDRRVHKCGADSAKGVSMMMGTMLTEYLMQRERGVKERGESEHIPIKEDSLQTLCPSVLSFSIHICFPKKKSPDRLSCCLPREKM